MAKEEKMTLTEEEKEILIESLKGTIEEIGEGISWIRAGFPNKTIFGDKADLKEDLKSVRALLKKVKAERRRI
jgi:hypothetical protein